MKGKNIKVESTEGLEKEVKPPPIVPPSFPKRDTNTD
jgi:hypothetical protein